MDRFVVYDDVSFIKQGWINRNRILVNGAPHMFTMPLSGAGSFTSINAIELGREYALWRSKFLRTLMQAYGKAPHHASAMAAVEEVLRPDRTNLSELLVSGLRVVMEYRTSGPSRSRACNLRKFEPHRAGWLLDICAKEGASDYVNPIGGKELYSKAAFADRGIKLWFVRSLLKAYPQFGGDFQPGLSILDAMMFLPPSELKAMLNDHTWNELHWWVLPGWSAGPEALRIRWRWR
ncbi:MAG: WbqC family protein [Flavobacteriales bacterium]|nr:WbqC family protein [Flavobacteriales bacterium]